MDGIINTTGRGVRRVKGRVLKYKTVQGYPTLELSKNHKVKTFRIHRLVALTFIPNPENKPQVNHINGIRDDNRLENLEWVTAQENQIHKWDTLGYTVGKETRKKLSDIARKQKIKVNGVEFESCSQASKHFGFGEHYFAQLLCRRKSNPNQCPQWDIMILVDDATH